MKKIGGLIVGIALAASGVLVLPAQRVAAACNNTSSFGSVMLQVPSLPKTGDFALWVRMQGTDGTAKVLLEANNSACFEVSASGLVANQWSWQAHRSGDSVQPIRFANTEGNTVEVIGVQAGVKVDKVLLTRPDCVPQEFGTNCADAIRLGNADDESAVSALAPPSNDPISGKVVLSGTPERYAGRLAKVSYTVQGRTVQSATEPVPFDTTLVSNGKHTVLIETELTGGQTFRESAVIDVENPENPLTPVVRWARVNWQSLQLVGIVVGSLFAAFVLLGFIRKWYRQRRELHFRGF